MRARATPEDGAVRQGQRRAPVAGRGAARCRGVTSVIGTRPGRLQALQRGAVSQHDQRPLPGPLPPLGPAAGRGRVCGVISCGSLDMQGSAGTGFRKRHDIQRAYSPRGGAGGSRRDGETIRMVPRRQSSAPERETLEPLPVTISAGARPDEPAPARELGPGVVLADRYQIDAALGQGAAAASTRGLGSRAPESRSLSRFCVLTGRASGAGSCGSPAR